VSEPRIVEAGTVQVSESDHIPPEAADVSGVGQIEQVLVEADTLIEDVSIDGMCGVY
jgi:mycofactocin precursor